MPSDDIIRLYTFTSGTDALASEVNGEFDQLIATINNKVGRATTETISGNKTFTGTTLLSGATTLSGNVTASADLTVSGTFNVGRASDPNPLQDGDFWYNTTSDILYARINGTSYDVAGYGYSEVNTDTTLTAASKKIDVDASGAARTITLPPVASSIGQTIVVSKYDSSANTVTIDGDSSDTIAGLSTYKLYNQFDSVILHAADTGWFVDGGLPPRVLLETKTASSSSAIAFSTVLTSEFSSYIVKLEYISPATDDVELRMEVKVGGTFQTTSYSNALQAQAANSATVLTGNGTADAAVRLNNSSTAGIGNAAGETYKGFVEILNPSNTNGFVVAEHRGSYRGTSGVLISAYGHGYYAASGAVTEIQFKMSSGNIASGTFKLYGIR